MDSHRGGLEAADRYLDRIDIFQLEISNFCNADCFHCVRTEAQSKYLNSQFLPQSIFERLLDNRWGQNLSQIEFCGTIDEPLAHPNFLEILRIILHHNPRLRILIHTNGSLRHPEYYAELADILNSYERPGVLRFSIDGLARSHYLYRGLNNFDDILQNARSFNSAGGVSIWQMIEFGWNSNEILRAKALAESAGFGKFILRQNRGKDVADPELERSARQANPNLGWIKPYQVQKQKPTNLSIDNPYANTKLNIQCHFRTERKMFLDHQGYVWPCCFLANPTWRTKREQWEMNKKLWKTYGMNFNSLLHHDLETILKSPWFESELTKSWSQPHTTESGCFAKCIKTCNNNEAQFEHKLQDLGKA